MTGQVPSEVGSEGERAVEVLWAASQAMNGESQKLLDDVRRWLGTLEIAEGIGLRRLGQSSLFEVVVTDPATAAEVNFADIGFGASQVLPIIVQSCCAKPESTLLVEQPEIHLHPKAQARLGDLFIEGVQGDDRAFIIETHSEHILARVRRRIAERKPGLTREKVAIYYFEPTQEGTRIKEVTLNEDGQYVDFPPGFFEEDVDEAFEHLKAMNEHA
jgi:predicted ATPase